MLLFELTSVSRWSSMSVARSSLLCERLRQEVQAKEAELQGERGRALELAEAAAVLEGRLQGEQDKCGLLSNQAAGLEEKLLNLSSELEAARSRYQELESGLRQQSNE
jgi:predicted nuclease with TOPRIM domain